MVRRLFFFVLIASALSGCTQGDSHVDDEKDPHFQQGRSLVNSEDYKGATEEFELALQANPHSAAAHFELGWLYEKAGDYAAAIYHYERHIKLQPNSPHAAEIQERIRGCKQELAKNEFPLPESQNLQRQVDKLNGENSKLSTENSMLRQQIDSLRAQLAAKPAVVQPPAPKPMLPPEPLATPLSTPAPVTTQSTRSSVSSSARPKTYVVKEHDTIKGIATRFGLKSSAILAANPHVDPRKLHVGQTLDLP